MSRYSSDSDTDYRRSIRKKDRSHSSSRSPYRSHKSGKYKHRRSPSSNIERKSRNRLKEYSKYKRKDRYRSRSNSSRKYSSKSRSSSASFSSSYKKKRSKRNRKGSRSRSSRRKHDYDSRSKSRSPIRKSNYHKKSKRRHKSDSDTESNCSAISDKKEVKTRWDNDKPLTNVVEESIVDFSKGVASMMTDNFQRQETIDRINEPDFEQTAFKSTKGMDMDILSYAEKDKEVERPVAPNEDKELLLLKNDTVFADNILLEDQEVKLKRWVRRLYNIGQQMLLESSKRDHTTT